MRRSLEGNETDSVLTAAEHGQEELVSALRPKLWDAVPAQVVEAVIEFCTESPREMEALVAEVSRFVSADKAGIREVVRELEEVGAIRNLGNPRRHRWVAADSRWGEPTCVSPEE